MEEGGVITRLKSCESSATPVAPCDARRRPTRPLPSPHCCSKACGAAVAKESVSTSVASLRFVVGDRSSNRNRSGPSDHARHTRSRRGRSPTVRPRSCDFHRTEMERGPADLFKRGSRREAACLAGCATLATTRPIEGGDRPLDQVRWPRVRGRTAAVRAFNHAWAARRCG